MRDRWRWAAVSVACELGRREFNVRAAPGEHGSAEEEGKWVGARENSTLLDLFECFKKT
jgi:hypothetical protein